MVFAERASYNSNKNHEGWASCTSGLEKGDVCGKLTGAHVSVPKAFLDKSITVDRLRTA